MGIGVVLSSMLVHIQLRCLFRNVKDLRYTDAEPQGVRGLYSMYLHTYLLISLV